MKIYNNIKHITEQKLEDNQYYIYVIENTAKNIKIGITKNISQRTMSLSGSNGGGNKPIRCAVSEPTYLKTLEKTIHSYFNKYRISGTEWFKDISFEEVIEYVDKLFTSNEYQTCNEIRKNVGGYKYKR